MNFNQIPINLLTPGAFVEFDNSKAVRGLVNAASRILMVVPMLGAGSATANVPFQLASKADAMTKLGRGSIGADMVDALFAVTDTIEAWILPIADSGAGAQATGTITVTGPATESGTLSLYVAGVRVQVGVTNGDTAAVVASNMAQAINGNIDLPVTASAAGVVVTVTSRHKGVIGNDINLRLNFFPLDEKTPNGLSLAIVQVGAATAGAGSPDLAVGLAAIGETQYNTMICAFTDGTNMALLESELEQRWGPLYQNDGHGHVAVRGTVGSLNSWASTRNSPHINAWAVENDGSPTPVWRVAALAGTTCAYYLGIDPSRPLQTLRLPTMRAASAEKRFTRAERNNVLSYGLATMIVDAGGNVLIERGVTTYTQNASGMPDPSYRDIETMATLSALRFTFRARFLQRFPRCKLAKDGTQTADQNVVTPSILKDEAIALYLDWIDTGWTEGGEGFEQFKRDLRVEINANDPNRADFLLPPDLINQLRVMAAQIQFRL